VLVRSAQLGLHDDDGFWIPLEELDSELDPDDLHRRASGARAAAHRAARWQMPVVVGGIVVPHGAALCGVGTGPRVVGRVVRFATLASAISVGSGDVVVTRAVTPALAVLVIGCAALVSETGGLLDHGAALARELGITCVVGCRDAWSRLDDGMLVSVDGAAGIVETAG
jgi:phosphohistidine swiveling domain-containing protein